MNFRLLQLTNLKSKFAKSKSRNGNYKSDILKRYQKFPMVVEWELALHQLPANSIAIWLVSRAQQTPVLGIVGSVPVNVPEAVTPEPNRITLNAGRGKEFSKIIFAISIWVMFISLKLSTPIGNCIVQRQKTDDCACKSQFPVFETGTYGDWGQWSTCSCTNNQFIKVRNRQCSSEVYFLK